MFTTLVRHGHKLEDIKYKYSIDQVTLFYKYCVEEELLQYRMTAISVSKANSLYAQYASKRDAQRAFAGFQDFLDSLTPEKVEEKKKKDKETAKDPMKVFEILGGMGLVAGVEKAR